jgi:hypothetical protein
VIGELVGQAARVGIEAVEQDTDELGVEDYLASLDGRTPARHPLSLDPQDGRAGDLDFV